MSGTISLTNYCLILKQVNNKFHTNTHLRNLSYRNKLQSFFETDILKC